jgi:DNA gyrase subunit B
MADADVDGAHIRTLLLTLLFRFLRPLISGGFVYLAQPPLFRLRWTNAPHELAYSDEERDAAARRGPGRGQEAAAGEPDPAVQGPGRDGRRGPVEHHHGSRSAHAAQVTLEDAAAASDMFSILMGEDVEQRRSFIQRNAKDVRFLDI